MGCGQPFGSGGGSGGSATQRVSSSGSGPSVLTSTASGGLSQTTSARCHPGALSSCEKAGEYCDATTLTCRPCADMARFAFGAPFQVTVSPPQGVGVAYPRQGVGGVAVFTVYNANNTSQIATAVVSGSTWAVSPSVAGPNVGSHPEAALYLPDESFLFPSRGGPALLFDDVDVNVVRVYEAALYADGGLSTPTPIIHNTVQRDEHVAVAPQADSPRFWWMSDQAIGSSAAGATRLVTALASSMDRITALPLSVSIAANGTTTVCPLDADNPWVTPDGTHLLFDGPSCGAGTSARRIYHVALGTDGLPLEGAPAEPILPDDTVNVNYTPSLSADRCTLYFARFATTASAVYAATRN